nr:hypothetical protein [Corynebacterium variabile]
MCFTVWAAVAPDNIAEVGSTMQSWVVRNLGWMYGRSPSPARCS